MINQQINNCISELLCRHNCYLIPQFGGFSNYSSAHQFNTNYMFAQKGIVFNRSETMMDCWSMR